MTEAENNPFYSIREGDSSIEEVVSAYLKSYKHWTNFIHKKFDRRKLGEKKFCLSSLDLDKKGYIMLEDLVRFMNM